MLPLYLFLGDPQGEVPPGSQSPSVQYPGKWGRRGPRLLSFPSNLIPRGGKKRKKQKRRFSFWHWNCSPVQRLDKQRWVRLIKPWHQPQTQDNQTRGSMAGSHPKQYTWKRSMLQPLPIKPFIEPSSLLAGYNSIPLKDMPVIHEF